MEIKPACLRCSLYKGNEEDEAYKCAVPGMCPGLRCEICAARGADKSNLQSYTFQIGIYDTYGPVLLCNDCYKLVYKDLEQTWGHRPENVWNQ